MCDIVSHWVLRLKTQMLHHYTFSQVIEVMLLFPFRKVQVKSQISKVKSESRSDFSKIRNKTRLSTLSTSLQYNTWGSSYGNKTRQGTKSDKTWKGRSQIFLFADDMFVYTSDHKYFYHGTPSSDEALSNMTEWKVN